MIDNTQNLTIEQLIESYQRGDRINPVNPVLNNNLNNYNLNTNNYHFKNESRQFAILSDCDTYCSGIKLDSCISSDNFVNGAIGAAHYRIEQGTLTSTTSIVTIKKDNAVIATDTFDLTTNKMKTYDNGNLCVELISINLAGNSAKYVVKFYDPALHKLGYVVFGILALAAFGIYFLLKKV